MDLIAQTTPSKICRACLQTEPPFLKLHEFSEVVNDVQVCIREMLMSIAFIQINVGDGLPEDICFNCAKKVSLAYNFKILCERSDAMLRQAGAAFTEQYIKLEGNLHEEMQAANILLVPSTSMDKIVSDSYQPIIITPDIYTKSIKITKTIQPKVSLQVFDTQQCFTCTVCLQSFPERDSLREHKKTHTSEMRHPCKVCGKSFSRVSFLHHHMVTHTEHRNHLCPVCGKRFHLASGLRQHLKYHSGVKDHACHMCEKRYYNLHLLREHVRCTHSNNRYNNTCSVCGKKFTAKSSLTMHMKIHTGERPHVCSVCSKRFTRGIYLRTHMRTHTQDPPEKLYPCPHESCDRKFLAKASLQIHIRHKHTLERPYACKLCPKAFSSVQGLHEHRTVHTKEKPEKCSTCNNGFVNKQSLKKHMRLHTGERPYPCPHCKERFLSSSRRNEHVQTKHMERKHECSLCPKRFHLKRTLNGHMKTHSAPKKKSKEVTTLDINPANMEVASFEVIT